MIISIIYLVLSFILDGFMSNIFPSTLTDISYFTTLYIIISFVIIYPYFGNERKYYILVMVFGLLFDILYTGTFIFNLILFFGIGIFIKVLYNIFPENVFTTSIISVLCIMIYHVISFAILGLISNISYDFMLLIDIVIHSLFMTILYTSISYFVMKIVYNRFNIKYIK